MSQPISDYAARRPKSYKIRLSILLGYFQHVAGAPDLPLSDAEIYSIKYLSYPLQQQQNALINYIEELKKIKSPGTVNQYVSTIKDWHKKNKIIFENDFVDELRGILPPNYSITEDESLTVEKIRAIVSHSDALLKAFILTACSSGARIGELMSLHLDDIEYLEEYDVYSFRLSHRKTKAGKPHRYFMSHEAMQAIRDFLRVRPQYISSRNIKSKSCLHHSVDDTDLLFVLTPDGMRLKLENAVKKAGLYSVDNESNRARIHPHSFRKFADTQFKEVVGVNMGNELIGHDEGLSKSYRRYDLRQLSDGYRKIEPHITIQAPADYVEVKTHIGGEVDKIRATLAAQSLELSEMRQRLENTELMLEIARKHNNQ